MENKEIRAVLKTELVLYFVGAAFDSQVLRNVTDDDEKNRVVNAGLEKSIDGILKQLDRAGYTIVKKEPALENYPSLT